jgi:hypothetical protein
MSVCIAQITGALHQFVDLLDSLASARLGVGQSLYAEDQRAMAGQIDGSQDGKIETFDVQGYKLGDGVEMGFHELREGLHRDLDCALDPMPELLAVASGFLL